MSSSSSQSNGVHFFKIIHKTILRDGELKVPTSFAKMYWEEMSNPVTLRLPNKTEWKVNWKKREGDIWLSNGLKDFAKDVSLSVFHFLVFQYQDNSCFKVIVLAKNGSEIKYPSTTDTTATSAEETQETEDESDYSVKVIDEPPPSLPAKRPKSPPQSSQPHKKKRKTNQKALKENHLCKKQSSRHHHHQKKKVEAHSGSSSKDLTKRIQAFHESIKSDFQSNKDFFTCAIRKSYLDRDLLIIPNEFSRPHLRNMVGRSAALFVDHDQNRRTWNVRLKQCRDQIHFVGGWKKFSMDNNLDIGDVCAFVLTNTTGLSFQVVNHPFKKDIRSPHSQGNTNDENKRVKKFHEKVKKLFRCKKDLFTCAMYKTYVENDQLSLPNEFSKLHLREMDGRTVTLFDVGKNKTWDVGLKKLQNGQFIFTSGWIKFSRDNHLNIGDVCAFVFIRSKGLSFQVLHFPFEKDIIIPHFEVNNSDQEELLNKPSSSLSPWRTPCSPKEFIFHIKKTPSQMTISIKHVKNFISESEKIVTLRVGEKTWPVKVILYEHYSVAKFSQGWNKFIRDCKLKEGACCYFKMVDEDKLVFEVTINYKMQLLN